MNETNYEQAESNNFNLGMVGDFIQGTKIKVGKTTTPDKWENLSFIYTIKAEEGSFHGATKNEKTGKSVINEEPTTIKKGEHYNIWVKDTDAKSFVNSQLSSIKLGQKLKYEFIESKPTDKGNDAKIVKVLAGRVDGKPSMDEEWLAEQETQYSNDAEAKSDGEVKAS